MIFNCTGKDSVLHIQLPKNPRLMPQLTVISVLMLALMTLYEAIKQVLFPAISIWESHAITIVFTTLLAASISFWVLKRFHGCYQELLDENRQRRITESTLKESEAKYRLLFEQSHDAIAIVTSDGDYIDVNPAYEQLFGYSRDELFGLNAQENWLHKDERNSLMQKMEADGYVAEYECRKLRKDGAEITLMMSSTQRRDSKGRVIFQSVCRDITSRKQYEDERERLIVDLQEALAKVRTLSGMLPICASCKRIRNDEGYWQQIELYISEHSDTVFSHGVCPECAQKLYPDFKGLKSGGRQKKTDPK
jgi:PAS domain S-box-containing protein